MSRRESDREDLFREATALKDRCEIVVPGFPENIVVGFRRDGSASVFFGTDLAYQFNAANQLRRGFVNGKLIKAERGQLVSLDRMRLQGEVQLVRHVFNQAETDSYLSTMREHFSTLRRELNDRRCSIVGQVPEGAPIVDRICMWLESLLEKNIQIARSPRVK